jgi:hypothetical protein
LLDEFECCKITATEGKIHCNNFRLFNRLDLIVFVLALVTKPTSTAVPISAPAPTPSRCPLWLMAVLLALFTGPLLDGNKP